MNDANQHRPPGVIPVQFEELSGREPASPGDAIPDRDLHAQGGQRDPAQGDLTAGPGSPARPGDPGEETGKGFVVHDRRHWNLSEEELAQEEERPKLPTFVEQLQSKLEERERQLREYIAAYKKEVGEGLERTKARLERESEAKLAHQRDRMLEPMLDVLDALDRSVMAAQNSNNFDALVNGVRMVQKLMEQKLAELGLRRIETVGHPFDPSLHEALAVAKVTSAGHENMVVAEFKPGFVIGDRVVRPAQVQVGKL